MFFFTLRGEKEHTKTESTIPPQRSMTMSEQTTNRLDWLLGQMNAGWLLEAPVIERPAYYNTTGQVSAFEFVLRHERGCQVVAVHDCPELRAFLRERGLECIAI
jgi:hypothetical protein